MKINLLETVGLKRGVSGQNITIHVLGDLATQSGFMRSISNQLVSKSDFNINTRFNSKSSNGFNGFSGSNEVDDALVDAHFKAIPSFGTFTTRCFAGGNAQKLGGKTNGSLYGRDILVLSTSNKLRAN